VVNRDDSDDLWPVTDEAFDEKQGATLPDGAELARLVSNVTGPMCGKTFASGAAHLRGQSICGRMFLLPIRGKRGITIVLSSDAAGSEALGAAMFGCPPAQLTRPMVDDAIRELLNMVGGQIQKALRIDEPLGLPRSTNLAEVVEGAGVAFSEAALLTSDGVGDLKLWIFEQAPEEMMPPPARHGRVRSLFRKLTSR
jgi:hypothetical protein